MYIMLNLPKKNYVYKLTFHFFLFKIGFTGTTFSKEEFINAPSQITTKMTLHTYFPCHKQPAGSLYCGYMCKHIRVLGRYSTDPEYVRGYSLLGIDVYVLIVFACI
jgi:hypothetical protein